MLKFDDYQFNYSLTGSRDNQPLLFLHGFMGSSNDFNNAIALLADQFYCLAIDLPGHGKTKVFGGEDRYTMLNTAQAAIALLDRLNITEKCFLVGYSMGGRLALYLTLHFPDRFAKVVLESTSPGLKTAGEKISRIQRDSQLAKELETGDFKAFLLNWYNQPIFHKLKKHPKFDKLLESRLDNSPLELAKSLRHMGTGSHTYLQYKLEYNKIPLLLLVGEYDDKFKIINEKMLKVSQVANMKIIKNCGHNIHFEDMNLWVRHLKEFCN
ncbi:2-succinyl-6-hydroxy-2,4-cyclohexadiene-1-carboxylate synthase [Argonema antarcticum]|uniref:2-succinyl-6-hydroxy-2, 4-cyclohexadiene-1-carboxylate synthase n=1 Tax=Argonema antarcticum TaxID=2942763 RepID=UPI002013949E|nr:2-succinyl-6-hydroxy-2,4-cyclohexadiene-1-carboxylate synthase [Argonema antarcticum]MCL1469290.1 2-succinyl-6-hydroxy-2,4-cyclohexadiene-1-carboxylate synthase [Argonema antarcticum A004/B2]